MRSTAVQPPPKQENPWFTLKVCIGSSLLGLTIFTLALFANLLLWQCAIFGIFAVAIARPINSWQSAVGVLAGVLCCIVTLVPSVLKTVAVFI